MRTKLQPYEENQIGLALFHGTGENVQLGPSEHWARHCPQNELYRHYWFYSQLQKPGKDCFKCFVLRSNDLQFWISFSSISVPKILLLSVQIEKILLFQCLRLLHFQKSYMNTKLRFQVGPGTRIIYPVHEGPCGLNLAPLEGIPPSVEFSHRPLLFPTLKTATCHFPTVNLVSYTNKKLSYRWQTCATASCFAFQVK